MDDEDADRNSSRFEAARHRHEAILAAPESFAPG